jgi:hypothetical protein
MFLGADVEGLDHMKQECEHGAQIADEVRLVLEAVVLACSIFGPFGAGFCAYLEAVVIPWLTKVSEGLRLFAKVLGANAQQQRQVSSTSSGGTPLALPTYTTPANLPPTNPAPQPIGTVGTVATNGSPGTTAPAVAVAQPAATGVAPAAGGPPVTPVAATPGQAGPVQAPAHQHHAPAAAIAQWAYQGGFRGHNLVLATAVAMAESGGDQDATLVNTDRYHSTDRGLWQINDHWHAEVSNSCAFDPVCAATEANRISRQGNDWSPWAAYKNGSYQKYIAAAQAAVAKLPHSGP